MFYELTIQFDERVRHLNSTLADVLQELRLNGTIVRTYEITTMHVELPTAEALSCFAKIYAKLSSQATIFRDWRLPILEVSPHYDTQKYHGVTTGPSISKVQGDGEPSLDNINYPKDLPSSPVDSQGSSSRPHTKPSPRAPSWHRLARVGSKYASRKLASLSETSEKELTADLNIEMTGKIGVVNKVREDSMYTGERGCINKVDVRELDFDDGDDAFFRSLEKCLRAKHAASRPMLFIEGDSPTRYWASSLDIETKQHYVYIDLEEHSNILARTEAD